MTEPIRITKATTKKDKPKDKDLAFGNVFTDHMFVMDFQEEKGWYDPRGSRRSAARTARSVCSVRRSTSSG